MAIFSLAGISAAMAAVVFAGRLSAVDAATTRRVLGLCVAAMVMLVGNLLPKLRPLSSSGADPTKAIATEMLAGRTLVVAGIADAGLFLFAPLQVARFASGVIGVGAIAIILASVASLALRACSGERSAPVPGAGISAPNRKVVVYLLFAFAYAFACACVAFLVDAGALRDRLAYWMTIAYTVSFAVLFAMLNRRRGAP
jgi:hypothetical protein